MISRSIELSGYRGISRGTLRSVQLSAFSLSCGAYLSHDGALPRSAGSDGRLPTDYEANLSLVYNIALGPVTITPQLYVFNLLNRQTVIATDTAFNINGTFVTAPGSPFYGHAGVEPGKAGPDGTICPATASGPCSDNPDYRKATARIGSRLLRAALKITF